MPLLLGILSIFFWGNLLFSSNAFSHDVFFRYFHPLQTFTTEEIRVGRLPLWNPYLLGGYPQAAEPLTALFYPAQILFRIFGFLYGSKLFVLFHTLLSALFGVLLGRKLFAKKSAGGLAGLLFGLHGFLIYHAPLLSQLASLSWIPASLLFMRRGGSVQWLPDNHSNFTRNPILLAFSFSCTLLAGYPTFFIGAILLLFFILLTRGSIGKGLLRLGSGALLSLLLSLPQLWASAELLSQTTRAQGLSLDEINTYSLSFKEFLIETFVPQWNLFFRPEGDPAICGFYIGLAILLALLGWFRLSRRRLIFFAGAAFFACVSMAAPRAIFQTLFLGTMRFPAQFLFGLAALLALLAARGFLLIKKPGHRAAIFLLLFLDLFLFARRAHWLVPQNLYTQRPEAAVFLQQKGGGMVMTPRTRLQTTRKGKTPEEAFSGFRASLLPNTGVVYHLKDADGYEVLRLAGMEKLLVSAYTEGHASRLWNQLGVKSLLSFEPLPGAGKPIQKDDLLIYDNPDALTKAPWKNDYPGWKVWEKNGRQFSRFMPNWLHIGVPLALLLWLGLYLGVRFILRAP